MLKEPEDLFTGSRVDTRIYFRREKERERDLVRTQDRLRFPALLAREYPLRVLRGFVAGRDKLSAHISLSLFFLLSRSLNHPVHTITTSGIPTDILILAASFPSFSRAHSPVFPLSLSSPSYGVPRSLPVRGFYPSLVSLSLRADGG